MGEAGVIGHLSPLVKAGVAVGPSEAAATMADAVEVTWAAKNGAAATMAGAVLVAWTVAPTWERVGHGEIVVIGAVLVKH